MRIFVLGASGGVGSKLLEQAAARGCRVTAQTRSADRLAETEAVRVAVGSPTDELFLSTHIGGHDALILCTGTAGFGKTTLFSDTAKAAIAAMQAAGVRRLAAITGIGAGETKGHGGWLYNNIIYPIFTRNRYADKDRQEAIIEQSDLDWTILRPAPFAANVPSGPLQVYTEIPETLQLTSITRAEVASFLLGVLQDNRFIHQKVFIGHP